MGVRDLLDIFNEYKSYRKENPGSSLTTTNKSSKNIITFLRAMRFGSKYGDLLYKHFGVMEDAKSYDFLINFFGISKLKQALSNPEYSTAQIADIIMGEQTEINPQQNYILSMMKNAIDFNRATGLEIMSLKYANPESLKRRTFDYKNIIQIFNENQVTKETLREIYDLYGEEIISQYTRDTRLKNATTLYLEEKYEGKTFGVPQDHVTDYAELDYQDMLKRYFEDGKLTDTERYIVLGLLTKESDLIGLYGIDNLRENQEYIKSEIDIGVFENIVVNGKEYTQEERKTFSSLSKSWGIEDFSKYENLQLLKQRLSTMPQTQEILEILEQIDGIVSTPLEQIQSRADEILGFMEQAYLVYETENRTRIIENVYNPENVTEIVITDVSQMGSSAMLHFFQPDRTMQDFDGYIRDIEERRSKELGREVHLSEEEKSSLLTRYQAEENHYITDQTINLQAIGQVGTWDGQYVTNTSNQLSAMVSTPEDILEGNGIRGRIALGFSQATLSPELIAIISNKNIYSNKGINYVESNNEFEDFSASYDELISRDNNRDNTELVLYRNSFESSLKTSYVLYIADDELQSKEEQENIEKIRKQMKEAGLKCPLIIFDRHTIREKMNQQEQSSEIEPETHSMLEGAVQATEEQTRTNDINNGVKQIKTIKREREDVLEVEENEK